MKRDLNSKAKIGKRHLLTLAALIVFCLTGCRANLAPQKEYGVFIGISTDDIFEIKGYETLVIDADFFSKETIERVHQNGNTKVYSYLNIGSIETFREGYDQFEAITLGAYENWPEERWVDVSRPEWQAYLADKAQALADKGIDGFFLDNADVFYVYNQPEIYQGVLTILQDLRGLGLPIIINGGDVFVSAAMDKGDLAGLIDGVNQETVFTSINFRNGTFGRQSAEDRIYLLGYISRCEAFGLRIYLLEYGAAPALEREIWAFCGERGYACFISPALQLDQAPR